MDMMEDFQENQQNREQQQQHQVHQNGNSIGSIDVDVLIHQMNFNAESARRFERLYMTEKANKEQLQANVSVLLTKVHDTEIRLERTEHCQTNSDFIQDQTNAALKETVAKLKKENATLKNENAELQMKLEAVKKPIVKVVWAKEVRSIGTQTEYNVVTALNAAASAANAAALAANAAAAATNANIQSVLLKTKWPRNEHKSSSKKNCSATSKLPDMPLVFDPDNLVTENQGNKGHANDSHHKTTKQKGKQIHDGPPNKQSKLSKVSKWCA